jgi:hypothetical protein
MSYDNLSSVSQNVLKFYQQLTGEERRGSLSFLVGTISNVLVMKIGWTDVGSGGYILLVQTVATTVPGTVAVRKLVTHTCARWYIYFYFHS